jgi:class 3 adenylate cyclase
MLGAQDVQLRIGMDVGRILLFELGPGLRDVAGSPVNVASKLAQDRGVLGAIQLTADAARLARIREALSTRTLAISGTSLAVVAI